LIPVFKIKFYDNVLCHMKCSRYCIGENITRNTLFYCHKFYYPPIQELCYIYYMGLEIAAL